MIVGRTSDNSIISLAGRTKRHAFPFDPCVEVGQVEVRGNRKHSRTYVGNLLRL